VCVCVCVCARARARACVCVYTYTVGLDPFAGKRARFSEVSGRDLAKRTAEEVFEKDLVQKKKFSALVYLLYKATLL